MSEQAASPVRVAGVILHRSGKVLLQHRDEKPGLAWPGAWAIFGGHVEPDETPEDAARREMWEELALTLEGPLTLVSHTIDVDRERFFFAAPLPVPLEHLVLHEGQGMAMISPAEFDNYPLVPHHRKILDEFFEGRATRDRP